MRKALLASLVLLAMASPVFAQTTIVTATVRDSSNIPYSLARVSAQLVPTGTAPTIGGQQISATAQTQADINGAINFNLFDNTMIVPGGSQWQITVCETPGVQPPLGTGSQCFTITATISGTTQSLTAAMNAVAPALTFLTLSTGTVTGTGTSPRLAVWSGASSLTSDIGISTPSPSVVSLGRASAGAQGTLQIFNGATANPVRLLAGVGQVDENIVLPPALGTTGQVLRLISAVGNQMTTGWSSGLPAPGSDQQVTYNDMGTAAGALGLLWDKINNRQGILLTAGQTVDPWFIEDSGFGLKGSFKPDGGAFFPYFNAALSGGLDTADAGAFRMINNEALCAEANPTGTDLCWTLNTSNVWVSNAPVNSPVYQTATNCADSAGAAACGSAAAGAVVIDATATTVVVSTTAVTANSEIFVQYDSSLGARLSVTCNVTVALPSVTARTAGASFTITVPAAPIANPACYSYHIVN